MGYPTSVFGPASRSNGQSIDASHVNDLQAEVTAIENALLGTITHSLNVSGASTLASAQIANSTLVNAQITNSTFSVRPVEPPPHAARVFLQSTYAAVSSAASTLSFLSQSFLTNSSQHSSGVNPDRLTPQSTGIYAFSAQVLLSGAPSGASQLRLNIVDSTGSVIAACDETGIAAAVYLNCSGLKRYDVLGGWASLVLLNISGGSTISLAAGEVTFLSMHKL